MAKRDGRNGRSGTDGGSATGPRTPPPESTGFEDRYLAAKSAAAAPVRIHMQDGESFEGAMREFDRDHIEVEQPGRRLRLRKSRIRYVEEI
jgi:hypothetical protein